MKRIVLFTLLIMFALTGLNSAQVINNNYPFSLEYNPQRTLINTIKTPAGYQRYPSKKMDIYMAWITNLPLKPKEHPVVKCDKQILMGIDSISGVIDLSVTSKNQKDADLPVQLMFEYMRAIRQLKKYPFLLTATDTVTYGKWLNGSYTRDARGNLIYKKGEPRESDEREYYRYLEFVMAKNENKTLLHNLIPVDETDIAPGCLYIQFDPDDPDSTGHTALILDVAVNPNDEKDIRLLAGWGGNPAHNLYIARPYPVSKRQWFTLDEFKKRLSEYGNGKFYKFKVT